LEADSFFFSVYACKDEDIPDTRNNWWCYDFKERRIAPTRYTIRTFSGVPDKAHLKSWLVETSADGEDWGEVACQENSRELNGKLLTGTFAVAGGGVSVSPGWCKSTGTTTEVSAL
jgi:hypothetical protein